MVAMCGCEAMWLCVACVCACGACGCVVRGSVESAAAVVSVCVLHAAAVACDVLMSTCVVCGAWCGVWCVV